MTREHHEFLSDWHRAVSKQDHAALSSLLASDVSLGAPPYWERFQGREMVHHLLGLILETIEGFTYHREWQHGDEIALEFTGRVGDLELQGMDLISLDDAGLIQRLDVLIRPMNAVTLLRDTIAPKMAAYLAEKSEGAAG